MTIHYAGHPDGYIGVDLDGTLVNYDRWRGSGHIGTPIPTMMLRVIHWRNTGKEVRIITARVAPDQHPDDLAAFLKAWAVWSQLHFNQILPVQAHKCRKLKELWDDRAVAVEPNTGRRLSPSRFEP